MTNKKSRARKTSSVPTRNWEFGLPFGPITNVELVEEHFNLAHKLYNALIAVEREYITKRRELLSSSEEVTILNTKLQALEAEEAELRAQRARNNSQARKRNSSPEITERLKELAIVKRAVKAELREARARNAKRIKPELDKLAEDRKNAYKLAYNSSGLHHGTYNKVVKAAERASEASQKLGRLPKFRRWKDGPGTQSYVGQQIISSAARLFAYATEAGIDVFSDKDTRIQLTPPNHKGYSVLKFRLTSDEKRRPIWVEFPIVLHRPFPPDAEIKDVRIKRVRIGPYRGPKRTRWRWTAIFTIESNQFTKPRKNTGHVAAVDLGWSFADEEGLRVGYLQGTDGVSAPINLPDSFVERMRIVDYLSSTRKTIFNEFRDTLKNWLQNNPGHALHEVLASTRRDGTQLTALSLISVLKSPDSLSRIINNQWMPNRVSGDEEIFEKADGWRRQNDHLHQWEAALRDKTLRARKEWYRVLASRLSKRYDKVVFEDLNLSTMAKGKIGGANRQLASPSEFRNAVEAVLGKHRVSAKNTSRTCSSCGGKCDWDTKTYRAPKCTNCALVWDRDKNAAKNILVASGAVISENLESRDLEELRGPGGSSGCAGTVVRMAEVR